MSSDPESKNPYAQKFTSTSEDRKKRYAIKHSQEMEAQAQALQHQLQQALARIQTLEQQNANPRLIRILMASLYLRLVIHSNLLFLKGATTRHFLNGSSVLKKSQLHISGKETEKQK